MGKEKPTSQTLLRLECSVRERGLADREKKRLHVAHQKVTNVRALLNCLSECRSRQPQPSPTHLDNGLVWSPIRPEDEGCADHALATEQPDLQLLTALARQRSEEHTSELQSRQYLVCRLLLEKKNEPQTT